MDVPLLPMCLDASFSGKYFIYYYYYYRYYHYVVLLIPSQISSFLLLIHGHTVYQIAV